jgi:hypothetical protein
MSYKNTFGKTNIRSSKTFALSISWDYDSSPKRTYPVFLFTPDMDNTDEHYHIALTAAQARKLKDWFDDYFKDIQRTTTKGRFR